MAALALVSSEHQYLSQLESCTEATAAACAGISFLDYLSETWMALPMWSSWSHWGRLIAASLMNVPVEGVVPTTNHLESFRTPPAI